MSADAVIVIQPEIEESFLSDSTHWWYTDAFLTEPQQLPPKGKLVNDDTSMGRSKVSPADYEREFLRVHPGDQYQRALSWRKASVASTERTDADRINFVRSYLYFMNEESLGERIAYFASDAELDEGDVPLTAESAIDFFDFFRSVESEGQITLSCSPEGWLCASWRFPDKRGASLWFAGNSKVMFAATDHDGQFIVADDGGEWDTVFKVAGKLVDAGLLEWSFGRGNSRVGTLWPVIAVDETLEGMRFPRRVRFFSGTESNIYPQTGASAFTPQIESYRSIESSTH